MGSRTVTTPPKEIWISGNVAAYATFGRKPSDPSFVRYILAPEHREPKRKVVAWVVRSADGRYLAAPNTGMRWSPNLALAMRWPTRASVAPVADLNKGDRVVALVRKRVSK